MKKYAIQVNPHRRIRLKYLLEQLLQRYRDWHALRECVCPTAPEAKEIEWMLLTGRASTQIKIAISPKKDARYLTALPHNVAVDGTVVRRAFEVLWAGERVNAKDHSEEDDTS